MESKEYTRQETEEEEYVRDHVLNSHFISKQDMVKQLVNLVSHRETKTYIENLSDEPTYVEKGIKNIKNSLLKTFAKKQSQSSLGSPKSEKESVDEHGSAPLK